MFILRDGRPPSLRARAGPRSARQVLARGSPPTARFYLRLARRKRATIVHGVWPNWPELVCLNLYVYSDMFSLRWAPAKLAGAIRSRIARLVRAQGFLPLARAHTSLRVAGAPPSLTVLGPLDQCCRGRPRLVVFGARVLFPRIAYSRVGIAASWAACPRPAGHADLNEHVMSWVS